VGWGDFSASLGGVGSVGCRSGGAGGFAGAFALARGFCGGSFTGGFFFESIFGADGSADSFDADAVGVASGFGVFAAGAKSVEAELGAVAICGPSGLVVCAAAEGAAVFGASSRGIAESGEAGVAGAVAIGARSGRIASAAAEGDEVFGA